MSNFEILPPPQHIQLQLVVFALVAEDGKNWLWFLQVHQLMRDFPGITIFFGNYGQGILSVKLQAILRRFTVHIPASEIIPSIIPYCMYARIACFLQYSSDSGRLLPVSRCTVALSTRLRYGGKPPTTTETVTETEIVSRPFKVVLTDVNSRG
jgi:hypothetical protein